MCKIKAGRIYLRKYFSLIILHVETNDLRSPVLRILADMRKLVMVVQQKAQGALVCISSIFLHPRDAKTLGCNLKRLQVNNCLQTLAQETSCRFLHSYRCLLKKQ
jgi:hypothetical protein